MKKQTAIAVIITTVAMWIAHRIDMKSYERICKDTVEWAIQDTSDATLAACENRIDELAYDAEITDFDGKKWNCVLLDSVFDNNSQCWKAFYRKKGK